MDVIWTGLPIEDILKLCETSKTFKKICDNPVTWNFLLERDFGIKGYQGDPKFKYMFEYCNWKRTRYNVYIFMFEGRIITSFYAESYDHLYFCISKLYNMKYPLQEDIKTWLDTYYIDNYLTPKELQENDERIYEYLERIDLHIAPEDVKFVLNDIIDFEIIQLAPISL